MILQFRFSVIKAWNLLTMQCSSLSPHTFTVHRFSFLDMIEKLSKKLAISQQLYPESFPRSPPNCPATIYQSVCVMGKRKYPGSFFKIIKDWLGSKTVAKSEDPEHCYGVRVSTKGQAQRETLSLPQGRTSGTSSPILWSFSQFLDIWLE